VQFCHFHIKQLVKRYVSFNTKNPILVLLKDIIDRLSYCEEKDLTIWISEFMFEYETFIKEKRRSALTGRSYFIRKELQSLLRSLIKNIPYIFTYRKYPELKIPNTTNSLEGFFTHLKIKVKIHRGLSRERRKKIIVLMLLNSSTVKAR
jgi:transposase-like protein